MAAMVRGLSAAVTAPAVGDGDDGDHERADPRCAPHAASIPLVLVKRARVAGDRHPQTAPCGCETTGLSGTWRSVDLPSMTRSALAGAWVYTRSIAAETRRSDMAVLALGCLGVGNLWARRGASGGYSSGWPLVFIVGFGFIVAAGALCYLAVGRPPGRPHAVLCAVAIGMQTLGPTYVMSAPLLWVTGLVLAAVPLIRHARAAWVPVIVGAALIVWATVSRWSWGNAVIDAFAEVQGSTQALIHGQNPYSPLYSIYLDSPLHHIVHGAASFNYGPAVVLLSVPARLIGDVRVTMVALNLAILVAALIWLRRGVPGGHLGPTLVALWVVSPFIPLMILNAWTDSVSMACAVWWLLLRDRHRNWSIACLALALASKPTFVPIVIPMLFWVIGAGTMRPLTPLTTPLHDLRLFGNRFVRLRRSAAS